MVTDTSRKIRIKFQVIALLVLDLLSKFVVFDLFYCYRHWITGIKHAILDHTMYKKLKKGKKINYTHICASWSHTKRQVWYLRQRSRNVWSSPLGNFSSSLSSFSFLLSKPEESACLQVPFLLTMANAGPAPGLWRSPMLLVLVLWACPGLQHLKALWNGFLFWQSST